MKLKSVQFWHGRTLTLAAALAAVAVTGCYNPNGTPNNTATGALVGGGFGAASGAIIGSASHSAGEGALIGAGAGALLGAIIGNSADRAQEARLQQQNPQVYYRVQEKSPLSVNDVKVLAKAQVSDDTIIAQIVQSHTIYHLTADDMIDLKGAGVSDKVVTFMVNTPSTISAAPVSVTVAQAPPPPPPDPISISPGPGYVWTGGEWVWNGGWYWQAGYWAVPPAPGFIWVGGYWGHGPYGWARYHGHWERR